MKPDDAWRSMYFGGGELPPDLQQRPTAAERDTAEARAHEARVALVAEAAAALLAGRLPSLEARMHVGGALLAWLRDGTSRDLAPRFLRVVPPRGSHRSAQRIVRERPSSHCNEHVAGQASDDSLIATRSS